MTSEPRRSPIFARAIGISVLATIGAAATAIAHDTWIIPDVFSVSQDSTIHLSGRASTRFPTGSAVAANRVADARMIGSASTIKISQMSVEGGALRLHQKAPATGQYLFAITLTPSTTRSNSVGFLRFLRSEGGAFEATRLEEQRLLKSGDSVVFVSTSYATTIVDVGRDGPRVYTHSFGIPLEFVSVNDPSHLHLGDTLHIRVMGGGRPVAGIGVYAGPALDTTANASASGANGAAAGIAALSFTADGNGVVHVPLTNVGAWNLRAAYVRPHSSSSNEWDVSRTTFVFGVQAKH